MLFTRQQSTVTDSPFRNKIVEQVQKMELQPKDKTRLADFALSRANYLAQFAWQSWNCSVVAVRVYAHEIRYGVNVPNGLVKKVLGMSAQASHAMKATASVEQMEDGKIVVVVQVPFASAVPTFADLTKLGKIVRGKFLFGYKNGQPVYRNWQDVLNIIVAGISQSGKTTTTCFLLAQQALNGTQFVVVDPHARAGEKALAHAIHNFPLIAPVAVDREQWIKAIRYVNAIGQKRINGHADRSPVLLVVDEANTLFDDPEICEELNLLLKEIVRAYSKVGVNAMCIAHDWRAASTGGSTVLRDIFQARYVHRVTRQSARTLVSNDYAEAIERQSPGQAHLAWANGDVDQIIVPLTTNEDMTMIGKWLEGNGRGGKRENKTLAWSDFCRDLSDSQKVPSAPSKSLPSPFQSASSPFQNEAGASIALPAGVSEHDILTMFVSQRMSTSKIVSDVFKLTSGRNYQIACEAINDILRGGIQL